VAGRTADPAYWDYKMSKEFGLDWHEQDARRMVMFMYLMKAEAKEEERRSKKNSGPAQSKFRPRM